MKKIIAYALSTAMLVLYAIPAYASSGGWMRSYTDAINETIEYIEAVTLSDSEYCPEVSGKVMHAKIERSYQNNTTAYIIAENSLTSSLSNGNYDFSFYAKGTFDVKGIYVGIGTNQNLSNGGMVLLFRTTRYQTTELTNGWKKYEFFNIPYNGSGSHFRFKLSGGCQDLYVDNVSLKASGSDEELIIDGGFENNAFIETEDVGNQAQYAPQNFIATQLAEHILLSWRNPENTNISKVSLYDITDGNETPLTTTLSKTASAHVNYDVTNLEAGSKHTYKLVCEFGASTTTESIISAVASSKREPSPLGVIIRGNHPGTSYYVHGDAHSGNGSVRIISNLQSWTSNNFIMAQTPTISFSSGSEYEISAWVKGRFAGSTEDLNYRVFIKEGTPSLFKYNGEMTTFTVVETENDWNHVVCKINNQGPAPIAFMGEHGTDMLVDDIEVWKLVGGERSGTPIYSEDYESKNYDVEDVTACTYEVGKKKAKINFTAPEGASRVRIYVKDGEKLSKRADVSAEAGSVTFTKLKNDYIYTYVIKAVDNYYNESAGQEIVLTPTPDDWECIKYGLYIGDTEITSGLSSSQTYTAKAVIKNNKVDAGVDAQIIAVIRKDGERYNAFASNAPTVEINGYDDSPSIIDIPGISISDVTDGEYEISIYLWDGLGTMTVLAPFKTYKEIPE